MVVVQIYFDGTGSDAFVEGSLDTGNRFCCMLVFFVNELLSFVYCCCCCYHHQLVDDVPLAALHRVSFPAITQHWPYACTFPNYYTYNYYYYFNCHLSCFPFVRDLGYWVWQFLHFPLGMLRLTKFCVHSSVIVVNVVNYYFIEVKIICVNLLFNLEVWMQGRHLTRTPFKFA